MAAVAPETPPEATPLPDPPTDGITALQYLRGTTLLASSSWDGGIRIHDVEAKELKVLHPVGVPLLSLAAAAAASIVYVGGLDGTVRALDISSSPPTATTIGSHNSESPGALNTKHGVSCLSVCGDGLLASASWSRKLCFWDVNGDKEPVATVPLPGKAFGMDYDPVRDRIVVATSGRRVVFVDVKTKTVQLEKESSLKYQTRCVAFRKDGLGTATGSIEGRVGMDFLEDEAASSGMKSYAFKCHRVQNTVYPVNCIAFHPRIQGTFATGGCDGGVVLWDGNNKKKLSALPTFPTSIAAMAINDDGTEIAIASSYTHEEGDREHPKDEIYVRRLLDSECQPKKSKK